MQKAKTIAEFTNALKMANDTFFTMAGLLLQTEAKLIASEAENLKLKQQLTSKK